MVVRNSFFFFLKYRFIVEYKEIIAFVMNSNQVELITIETQTYLCVFPLISYLHKYWEFKI